MLFLLLITPLLSVLPEPIATSTSANDTLIWSSNSHLSWDDFYADAPSNSSYAAFTYTIINMEYSVKIVGESLYPEFQISAAFNRRKSWVQKRSEAQTPAILKHEQGHFDIAELTARKLRKRLKTATYSRRNYKELINSMYQSCVEEGENLQALYDRDTQHGLEKHRQADWLNRIAKELSEYAQWAN